MASRSYSSSETTENNFFSGVGKQMMLVSLLAKDRIISNNGKAFLKELILRRDRRIAQILTLFEDKQKTSNTDFLEQIHELILDESRSFYEDLFEDTSLEVGKHLSKGDRDHHNLNNEKSLIYGEVDYVSFYRVLRKIKPEIGWTFYDLGSGTSKAVMAARFTQDFGKCIGIEILPSLHKQALKIVERYEDSFKSVLSTGLDQEVEVCEGSFLQYDWSDGDVVFANSTCFDDKLMDDMSRQAESLRPGTFFVTFTKGLTSKKFEVLERKRYRMSWGPATVYIHRRLGLNNRPVGGFRLCTLPSDNIEYDDEVRANEDADNAAAARGDDDDDDDEDDDDGEDNDEDEDGEEEGDGDDEEEEEDDEESGGDDDDEEEEDSSNTDDDDDDDDNQGDDEEDEEEDEEEEDVIASHNRTNASTYTHTHPPSSLTASSIGVASAGAAKGSPKGASGGSSGSSSAGADPNGNSYAWRPPQAPASEMNNIYHLRPPHVELHKPSPTSATGNRWLDSPQDSELLKRKSMAHKK